MPPVPDRLRAPFDWRHDLVGDTGKLRRGLGYNEPDPPEEAMAPAVARQRAPARG